MLRFTERWDSVENAVREISMLADFIYTSDRREHSVKAFAPIKVTDLGMVTDVRFRQPAKACSPMY